MRYVCVVLCVLLLTLPAIADEKPADEKGFVSLFDGKTFKGWNGNLDLFRIEDGAIVGGSLKERVPRNEFLTSAKDYSDFELRLKFKLLGKGANAGVQVRSKRIPNHNEMIGYQPDLGEGWWGCLYDESRRRKVLAGPPKEERNKLVKANDWNEYTIRCEGRRIQLWINGHQTVDYSEPDASIPQTGLIGLQIHGGPPSEAWYKEIRIRELNKAEENLAAKATFLPQRSLDVVPYSVANLFDGKITLNRDIRLCESCWCGGNVDLAYQPLNVVVDFGSPQVIDRVVVTTCRLKNQQRLTDFDVYGWAGSDWDGHRPLAAMRDSKDLRMELRFDAVSVSKICIRLLNNVRQKHNFPHISEVEVYAAAGPPVRKLTPGGLPKPLAELTTLALLEAEAAKLKEQRENGDVAFSGRRLELVENKLAFQREALPWKARLDEVEQNTKRLIALGVPGWAAAQSEALSKYVLWIHWWLDHAQPDGQFGGGLNDDVELVCGWPLACLAADDRRTFDALALLGETVWDWGPVKEFGYSRYTDVEHSAEEISYSQPRMVLLDYTNPKWAERCALTTHTCLREFMSENGRGNLQFRSDYFGYKNGRPVVNAERPFDVPEGAKALKPTLYAAWSGNEEAKRTVLRYGDTWLDAAMQEYEGKPRGLLPAQISFETGKPQGMALRMPPMRATHYHLIGCYLLSGDPKYLAPAEHTIRHFLVENARGDLPLMQSGNMEHMGLSDQLAIIASLWRILSKNESMDPYFERWSRRLARAMGPRYESYAMVDSATDELWIKEPLPVGAYLVGRRAIGSQFYIGWLAAGDKDLLECGCRNLGNNISDMWGPLTWWFYDKTESRVTSNDHSAHSIQTAASMLMMMYTGGCGPIEAKYPYTPVRWEGTTVNFAALVLEADRSHVKLLAANLEPEERQVTMRLGELTPGEYLVTRGPDADGDDVVDSVAESKTVSITRHAAVELTLPSREMQVVRIRKP